MKTSTKRILAVSSITAGAGLTLLGIGMGLGGCPGVVFSNSGIHSSYQQQEPYFQEKVSLSTFSNLSITIKSEAEVQILPSDDDKFYIEYRLDGEYGKPVCKVENDTLTLSQAVSGEHVLGVFGLNFGGHKSVNPYVTLYVPEDSLLKQSDIYSDYGIIEASGIKFHTVSITADSGDIILNNISAENMKCATDNGTISSDAIKADSLSVLSSYGSVELRESVLGSAEFQMEDGDILLNTIKADSLNVTSEYGNVILKEASCKTADFTMDYGDLDFDAVNLENLYSEMEDGDIHLSLPETVQNYQLIVKLDYGDLELPKDAAMEQYCEEDGEISYHADAAKGKTDKKIDIRNEYGNVKIRYR